MADPLEARLDFNLRATDPEALIAWYSRVFGTKLFRLLAGDPEQGDQRVGSA